MTTSIIGLPCPLYNPSGQVVGRITADNGTLTLHKRVKPDAHQMTRPAGYCLAVEHLELLRQLESELGLPCLVRLTSNDGTAWRASLEDFDRFGIARHFGGYEPQRLLPLDRWTTQHPAGWQPALFEAS